MTVMLRIGFAGMLFIARVWGQEYWISTYAGGGTPPESAPALNAIFGYPNGAAVDTAGRVYFGGSLCVFRLDSSGAVTRVAGTGGGYSGDGGPSASAQLSGPFGLAVDRSDNFFIADAFNDRIRKVSPSGIITTVAGTGARGYSGDDGPATGAQLSAPIDVAVDSSGNLYIADDEFHRVLKVSADGIVTIYADLSFTPAGGYSYGVYSFGVYSRSSGISSTARGLALRASSLRTLSQADCKGHINNPFSPHVLSKTG